MSTIKPEVTRKLLASSATPFQNLPGVSRSTSFQVLRDMAKKYLKTSFSKVLRKDEMRVTLHGADGWVCGWTTNNGHRVPV